MKSPDQDGPAPNQNPQFDALNNMVARYIAALDVAKRMEEKAKVDPLTGLPNQYKLEEDYTGLQRSAGILDEKHERAADVGPTKVSDRHSILMADLDYFKDINDSRGHGEGNRLLREVADVMSGRLRKRDVAARIGCEEFAILLPHTGIEQAVDVAEDIRQRTEDTGDVTLSIGVVGVDLAETLEENLERADSAMYLAKEYGRNQVVQYRLTLYRPDRPNLPQ
jgi:diguanylate cyclase (GGDEF)-like protein